MWRIGVVVGVCGLLAFAGGASAHHGNSRHKSEPLCDVYFGSSEISALTGTPMEPAQGYDGNTKPTSWPAGTDNSIWSWRTSSTIAGSECEWNNKSGPGLGDGDSLEAWAAVGYREPPKDFKEMRAHNGPPFTSEEGTRMSTKKVNLGYHAQAAYVQKFDLWSETGIAYFDPPKYLYAVTVLTKHHDVLLLAPETASLSNVEAAVQHALKAHPSF